VDAEYGTASQIASTNYALKEPATRSAPWADALVGQYNTFHGVVTASGLPAELQKQVRRVPKQTAQRWCVADWQGCNLAQKWGGQQKIKKLGIEGGNRTSARAALRCKRHMACRCSL